MKLCCPVLFLTFLTPSASSHRVDTGEVSPRLVPGFARTATAESTCLAVSAQIPASLGCRSAE